MAGCLVSPSETLDLPQSCLEKDDLENYSALSGFWLFLDVLKAFVLEHSLFSRSLLLGQDVLPARRPFGGLVRSYFLGAFANSAHCPRNGGRPQLAVYRTCSAFAELWCTSHTRAAGSGAICNSSVGARHLMSSGLPR